MPAVADTLTPVREQLAAWTTAAGLDRGQVDDVAFAVYEAMANVVDHAYDLPGGTFDLHACRHADLVTITVADHGQWKAPAGAEQSWRGRGLLIIERAAREFALSWSVRSDVPSSP